MKERFIDLTLMGMAGTLMQSRHATHEQMQGTKQMGKLRAADCMPWNERVGRQQQKRQRESRKSLQLGAGE